MGDFKFDISKLKDGLANFQDRAEDAFHMKAQQYASMLQADAQNGAKWTDRTGEARRRLNGSYEVVSSGYKLILSHGVDYGIWLELANEKRYAIIIPTIQQTGNDKIMPDFNDFINELNS